jgi:hypothetical protein
MSQDDFLQSDTKIKGVSKLVLFFLFLLEFLELESSNKSLAIFSRVLPIHLLLPCGKNPDAPFLRINNASWRLMTETVDNVDKDVLRLFLNGADDPIHMPWQSVRQCLIGRRISFVGDSLTRYQYLNLVHFITHGTWYSSYPPFEHEPLWNSWLEFYQGTTARLTTKNGISCEKCDCYRNPSDTLSRENRYYENSELNLTISYFQHSVGISKRGMDYNSLTLSNCREGLGCTQASCSPGNCMKTHWIANDHIDLLKHAALTLHPDTVIFNSGIWHRLNNPHDEGFTSPERINDLIMLAQIMPAFGVQRFIWKTTTAVQQETSPLGESEAKLFTSAIGGTDSFNSWTVFDAYSLTSNIADIGQRLNIPLYYDSYHFIPDIYRGLNEALLLHILKPKTNDV